MKIQNEKEKQDKKYSKVWSLVEEGASSKSQNLAVDDYNLLVHSNKNSKIRAKPSRSKRQLNLKLSLLNVALIQERAKVIKQLNLRRNPRLVVLLGEHAHSISIIACSLKVSRWSPHWSA